MEKDTSMLIIGIGFCLMAVLFVVSIIDTLRKEAREKAKGGRTQAKVIRIDQVKRTIANQAVYYEPILSYMVDGQRYAVQYDKGTGFRKKYRLGDTVSILYDEQHPENIYVPGDGVDMSYVGVFGFGILVMGYMAAIALGEYFFGVNLRFWQQ